MIGRRLDDGTVRLTCSRVREIDRVGFFHSFRGTEESEDWEGPGGTRFGQAGAKAKAKPNHEETPEGCEEKAKKIVAQNNNFKASNADGERKRGSEKNHSHFSSASSV